jgi:hypothetical protein
MNTRTHLSAIVIGTSLLLSTGCIERRIIVEKPPQTIVVQQPSAEVLVAEPPPADKAEVVTPSVAPGPDYIWVNGYWVRQGASWLWTPGTWVRQPHANAAWIPGHWQHQPGGWAWIPGHWI